MAILLALAGIFTFIAIRDKSYWILKVIAGFAWIGLAIYWLFNPLIAVNDSVDQIITTLLIGWGIALIFMPMWYTKSSNGNIVSKGFRWTSRQLAGDEEESTSSMSHSERASAHRMRVEAALQAGRRRRR